MGWKAERREMGLGLGYGCRPELFSAPGWTRERSAFLVERTGVWKVSFDTVSISELSSLTSVFPLTLVLCARAHMHTRAHMLARLLAPLWRHGADLNHEAGWSGMLDCV